MIWSTKNYYNGYLYGCDICGQPGESKNGRWWCKRCEYDVCENCIPKDSIVPENAVKSNSKLGNQEKLSDFNTSNRMNAPGHLYGENKGDDSTKKSKKVKKKVLGKLF